MKKKSARKFNTEEVRQKLKLKSFEVKGDFSRKYSDAEKLLAKKGISVGKIREHSAKLLGAGALAGTLLIAPPTDQVRVLPEPEKNLVLSGEAERLPAIPTRIQIVDELKKILPGNIRPLTHDEEKVLERLFLEKMGISARGTLEGEHLNTTYGKIGAEQHLRRYPGDTITQHAPGDQDYGEDRPAEMLKEGMAPGLGAWGYFAPSKQALTPQLAETERWYAVVQTLYLPDWNERVAYLRDWYKFRKVLIVNTDNGKAVVAAIADSGPAAWTGKHFGGSPEVMDYLGGERYKKGPVILFFVDDPDNKVPLGPVVYN